jgi:hypothetical protein
VTCTDGVLSSCSCEGARCAGTEPPVCRCEDGTVSTRPCLDGVAGACRCEDAAAPRTDAGVPARCAPAPSTPTPLDGLPAPGSWEVSLGARVLALAVRADGYLVVTTDRALLVSREGVLLHEHVSDRPLTSGATLSDGRAVVADGAALHVLSDTLAPLARHLLPVPCIGVADIGCNRALCVSGDSAFGEIEIDSGESRVTRPWGSSLVARMVVPVPGQDAVVVGGFGPIHLLLTPGDRPFVYRALGTGAMGRSVPFAVVGGTSPRILDAASVVWGTSRCFELSSATPCGGTLGSVASPAESPRTADLEGHAYVMGEGGALDRYDLRTLTFVSRHAVPLAPGDRPRELAHDAWGRRVVLAFERCAGACVPMLTTVGYGAP